MNIEHQYNFQHRAFRKYLRDLGIKSQSIDNIVNALEVYLSRFVKERIDNSFSVIYADCYDITYLLNIYSIFQSNQDWLVEPQGYTSQEALKHYLNFFAGTNGIDLDDYLVVKVPIETELSEHTEGGVFENQSIKYERDPRLRAECIDRYGCKCFVCGFDFEKVYGEAGRGFIEVHHLIPLNVSGCSHTVSTDELRPLCSNCHSIIHRRKRANVEPERDYYSIDELKEIISNNNNR